MSAATVDRVEQLRADRKANLHRWIVTFGLGEHQEAFAVILDAETPDNALCYGHLIAEEAAAAVRPHLVMLAGGGAAREVSRGEFPAVEGVTVPDGNPVAELPAWMVALRFVTEDGVERDLSLRLYGDRAAVERAAYAIQGHVVEASGDTPPLGVRAVGHRLKIAAREPVRIGRLIPSTT